MHHNVSLRLRVTLISGLLLVLCCVLLTISNNYYASQMADKIQMAGTLPLMPIQPAYPPGTADTAIMAREAFRSSSLGVTILIVISGCLLIYWLTGRSLRPLRRLDQQIRSRTAADLQTPLSVPDSGDEVASLTTSFNTMSHNLYEAFEQQRRFSQSAAHELRTPLAVLKTKVELFRKKGCFGPADTLEFLDVTERQIDRLSALVADLLELTNMDAVPCNESVSLSPLLQGVAEELFPLAVQKEVHISVDVPCCTVIGSRALLERAFFNLLENAIKYNRPQGGVEIRAVCRKSQVDVSISDQGSGIPHDLREEIFEPFFRVDKSRSRQMGGAGLGLSLVRSVVALHHGRIRVEDAPGGGSLFVVSLPLAHTSQ